MRALALVLCVSSACGPASAPHLPATSGQPEMPVTVAGDWRGQGLAYVGVNTRLAYPVRVHISEDGDLALSDVCPVSAGGIATPWYGETRGLYWTGRVVCPPIALLECEAIEFVFTGGAIRPANDGALLIELTGAAHGCALTADLKTSVVAWPTSTDRP